MSDGDRESTKICDDCNGSGYLNWGQCHSCAGTGLIYTDADGNESPGG